MHAVLNCYKLFAIVSPDDFCVQWFKENLRKAEEKTKRKTVKYEKNALTTE